MEFGNLRDMFVKIGNDKKGIIKSYVWLSKKTLDAFRFLEGIHSFYHF